MERETRTFAFDRIEVRADDDAAPRIEGHAAVFNRDSEPLGPPGFQFIERIKPGAFKRALEEEQDVVALWNHDRNEPLGRNPDTLQMREDKEGLAVDIQPPATTRVADVLELIRTNVVRGMSFAFRAVKETWEEVKDGPDIRTIEDLDLFDVSVVVSPAYRDTDVAVRHHEAFLDSQKREQEDAEADAAAERTRQEQVQQQAEASL